MITLTKPMLEADDARAVADAVVSGASGSGPVTARFEAACASFFGTPGAVATNSCTSALILALRALGVGPNAEVILPSYTCLAVLNAVVSVGATPVLADCAFDPARMDMNLTTVCAEERRSERTRAIILPHMFGTPADTLSFRRLNIPIIEDVTLSLGARRDGVLGGTLGDATVCSFHESKMLSCGEGGIFTSRDRNLVSRARYLNGFEAEQPGLRTSRLPMNRYELRYNYLLSDLSAALGLSQWNKLDRFVERRRALAQRYTAALRGIRDLVLPEFAAEGVFHRYMIAIGPRSVVPTLEAFAREHIEVGRGVYPPLHTYLGESGARWPNTTRAVESMISIPLYPALTEGEVERVLAVSRKVLA